MVPQGPRLSEPMTTTSLAAHRTRVGRVLTMPEMNPVCCYNVWAGDRIPETTPEMIDLRHSETPGDHKKVQ